jgi:uncharacterized hydrophobic protein (TIGR00271 family)
VIIGAMLVAPLMAAIFGLSLSVVRGDLRLLRLAASATVRGMLLAIFVGGIVGLLYFLIAPGADIQAEILSRTQPNLLDLGVALASGAAGAYALCRKEVSASLPGVAIAAALVPPLAVGGIGLGMWLGGLPHLGASIGAPAGSSGPRIAGGALLLFLVNLVAIVAAGGVVFLWLGFRPIPGQQARAQVFQRGVVGTVLMLVAITVPLGILTARTLKQAALNRDVNQALEHELSTMRDMELQDWEMLPAEEEDDEGIVRLQVWVRSPWSVTHYQVVELQERLAVDLGRPVALLLSVIPTQRLDPFVPPTAAPTSPLGATATPTPTPTATPTWTSTPSRTPTWTSTPTATSTPTPTATATPTPTPTATGTSTPTPTPTWTPTPALAQVGGTDGEGVWMYLMPGLEGGKITAWRDGTLLILTGEQVEASLFTWIEVIDPKGRLGWIPARYLIRLARPPE